MKLIISLESAMAAIDVGWYDFFLFKLSIETHTTWLYMFYDEECIHSLISVIQLTNEDYKFKMAATRYELLWWRFLYITPRGMQYLFLNVLWVVIDLSSIYLSILKVVVKSKMATVKMGIYYQFSSNYIHKHILYLAILRLIIHFVFQLTDLLNLD